MNEKIYTIPVNESFDRYEGCPVCHLHDTQESNELDIMLGGAMMEPDIRIQTNKLGFCGDHLQKLYDKGNRLSLALILQTHLTELTDKCFKKKGSLRGDASTLDEMVNSCYICNRLDRNMNNFFATIFYLYRAEPEFREKLQKQPYFCLHHYTELLNRAPKSLHKKEIDDFFTDLKGVEKAYVEKLNEDIDWFCKKFDYRFKDEDWKDSKDAVERVVKFLTD